MTINLDEIAAGVEAALKRAAVGVRRQAQASGIPLVWCRNGQVQHVRIAPDGSETIVKERPVNE